MKIAAPLLRTESTARAETRRGHGACCRESSLRCVTPFCGERQIGRLETGASFSEKSLLKAVTILSLFTDPSSVTRKGRLLQIENRTIRLIKTRMSERSLCLLTVPASYSRSREAQPTSCRRCERRLLFLFRSSLYKKVICMAFTVACSMLIFLAESALGEI